MPNERVGQVVGAWIRWRHGQVRPRQHHDAQDDPADTDEPAVRRRSFVTRDEGQGAGGDRDETRHRDQHVDRGGRPQRQNGAGDHAGHGDDHHPRHAGNRDTCVGRWVNGRAGSTCLPPSRGVNAARISFTPWRMAHTATKVTSVRSERSKERAAHTPRTSIAACSAVEAAASLVTANLTCHSSLCVPTLPLSGAPRL